MCALIVLLLAPAGWRVAGSEGGHRDGCLRGRRRIGLDAHWDAPWDHDVPLWSGREPLSSDVAVTIALQANRSMRQQVEAIVAARPD